MKDNHILYWLWLADACGIACKPFVRLMERYDDPFDIYRLEEEEIEQMDGLGAVLKERLCRKSLERSYAILRDCKAQGIDIISYGDSRYPDRLRRIEDPPVLLYCKGTMPDMNSHLCIGMVGTRSISEYGKQTAYKISYELAASRAVVVSGMAKGVDGVCAAGALAAGGKTVAVLGCGIRVVYPKEHKRLMEAIAASGAVLTEYPPDEPPNNYHFPKRNRIISGLCQGVLVVEGDMKSGALITAKKALAQGREVFALPGKIDEKNSEGPNELIQNGAYPVLSSLDITEHYDFLYHDVIRHRSLAAMAKQMPLCEETIERFGVCIMGRESGSKRTWTQESSAVKPSLKTPVSVPISEKPNASAVTEDRSSAAESASAVDGSAHALASVDDFAAQIFAQMPLNRAVTPDALDGGGRSVAEVMTALTMLELNGLVTSLPGGMYLRS
ncbi:MAG: DNA-processing protein DprA [Clostridia bacterium]|nr:DNA-processing protein DprA [Clostridia bacterium]